jgi:hypothetical protein
MELETEVVAVAVAGAATVAFSDVDGIEELEAAAEAGAVGVRNSSHFGNAPTKPAAHWLHTRPA